MKPRARGPLPLLLFVGSCTLGATTVQAQETTILTMEEALDRAARFNPDYRMAQNDLELSRAGRREAWGAFLPDLTLNAGTSLNFDRQRISTDFFGNPIENPVTEWVTNSGSSQQATASVVLFEGGQRFHQLAAQGAQAEVREATAAARLRTLRSEVVRAFAQALEQQALLRVEEELLAGREVDLELTRRMFELAGATRVDVLAAELNVQRQEQQIQQAQALLDQALLSLRTIVADPELDAFTLDHEVHDPFDPGALDEEGLVSRALINNPQVLEQGARLELSRAQTRAARGSRWPTLSLSFTGFQRTFAQNRDALFDFFPNDGRTAYTNLSLRIPLFSRFQTEARVAEAVVAQRNARETLKRTSFQVEENVRSGLIGLRTAYQSYQIAVRSREIAEERLRLAREQFRLGSRTFSELQRDIDDAATAERDLINRLFQFLDVQVGLEELVGELSAPVGGGDSGPGAESGAGEESGGGPGIGQAGD